MSCEDLKYLYYRDNVRTLEEFTRYIRLFLKVDTDLTEAFGYYINKSFNSSHYVLEALYQRPRKKIEGVWYTIG